VSKSKRKRPVPPPPRGPLILALETATDVSSAAIFEGPKLLGTLDFHANKLHARLMTVLIQQLLENLQLKASDLAGVGVTQGPGSYTGLRVGTSVAKGMAMALDIPLLSVGSLDSLAASVMDIAESLNARIIPLLDARRMEVYCGVFSSQAEKLEAVQAYVLEEQPFSHWLDQGKVIFVGDGALKSKPLLIKHPNAIVLENRLSSAANMGFQLWKLFQAEQFEDLVTFEPFYLKNFVATISKKKLL